MKKIDADQFNRLYEVGSVLLWVSPADKRRGAGQGIKVKITTPAEHADKTNEAIVGIESLDGEHSGMVPVAQLVKPHDNYTQDKNMSEALSSNVAAQPDNSSIVKMLRIEGDTRMIPVPEGVRPGQVSDGYHTFDELYAHRVRLFQVLMNVYKEHAWWSRQHFDGVTWQGWILAGIDTPDGAVTYHLPESAIEHLPAGTELERGKEWDGHVAEDVLQRLLTLVGTEPSIRINEALRSAKERLVFQYSATVNTPRGPELHDGIQILRPISSFEMYGELRALIAADLGVPIGFINVRSVSIIGTAGEASA